MKKYALDHREGNFWRIRAVRSFSDVEKGAFGGLIESERNLSHDGDCWIYDDSYVFGRAQVRDDAKVCGGAWVGDSAQIYEKAVVTGSAWIALDTRIHGTAVVDFCAVQGDIIITPKKKKDKENAPD